MGYPEFHYKWEWRLHSSPERLWPFVADTNRFNRDTGLPSVSHFARGWHATRISYVDTTQEPARCDHRPCADAILLPARLRHGLPQVRRTGDDDGSCS